MKAAVVFIETVTEANNQSIADIYNKYILPDNVNMEESVYDFYRSKALIDAFSGREKMQVLSNENQLLLAKE